MLSWLIHDPLTRFLAQLIVIIVAARLLGRVVRRMNQPLVIAEIAAGILLGPSLLGWLFPDVSATLFPESSLGALKLVSEIGLVLFMFLVGLELDTRLLTGRKHASVVISHTSIAVPFVLGLLISVSLHPRFAPGAPFWAFALFMGAAMSVTAFPVLARILTERRLDRTRVGVITITCAAVDDVTAWCILAFVVGVSRADGLGPATWTTVAATSYVAFMFFAVRPLLQRLAARFTRPGDMSQNVVAIVLVGAFLSAWMTERIGIHALFGAFLFGAVLPKEGGFARAVAEKLEDLVLVALLPLFFAYSGLRTEIQLLDTPYHWLVTLGVVAVACIGKFGGATLPARWSGLSWRESSALGILMNTRGLMELIVLNIGLDLGVISPTVFSMMVVMALVTTVLTSPLLSWFYPPHVMARDAAEHAPPALERGGTLLCVGDARTGPALASIAVALEGAENRRIQALYLSNAGERGSERMGSDEASQAIFAPLQARAHELGAVVGTLALASTDPGPDIVRVADERQADLVLLGLHRPMLSNSRLGGVVYEVLRSAGPAVGVFVDRGLGPVARVLVPFQGSEHDHAALELAHQLQARGAEVTVLHVAFPGHASEADEAREAAQRVLEGRARFEVVESRDPARAVLERSQANFDLVVVGLGPGWGLEERRFGLEPELLLEQGGASLLVVRARKTAAPRRRTRREEPSGVLA